MNALQHNEMATDAFLANHSTTSNALCAQPLQVKSRANDAEDSIGECVADLGGYFAMSVACEMSGSN